MQMTEAYGRLSHDGAAYWPILLDRVKRMWTTEPEFTRVEVENIEAATIFIVGDIDLIMLEYAIEMYRVIPHAQLCVMPNAGHGVLPQELILAFLQETSATVCQDGG